MDIGKTKISKKWKIVALIFGATLLIISIILWIISVRLEPIIAGKLKQGIESSSKGLYKIDFNSLDIHLINGSAELRDVTLQSDSNAYKKLDSLKDAPDTRFQGKIASIRLNNLNLWKLIFSKRISIGSLALDSTELQALSSPRAYNKEKKSKDTTDLYQLIKESFKSVELNKLNISPLNITYLDSTRKKNTELKLQNVSFQANNILIDEHSGKDTLRFLYTKEIAIQVPKFTTILKDKFYKIELTDLAVNSGKRTLELAGFNFVPTVNRETFARNDQENKSLITLKLDSITLSEIDFPGLYRTKTLKAIHAKIGNGNIDFFKDKRYQKEVVSKIGESPAQQIMKMSQKITLDTVKINNIDLRYSEISEKYGRMGTIDFKKISGNIINMTNDSLALSKNKRMIADLHGYIYGEGKVNVRFGFDMLSSAGAFTYNGTLGKMRAPTFNNILQPLINIKFADGNIQRIKFDMQGNDHKSWGQFNFDYDHLKLDILRSPDDDRGGKKGFLSFFANTFFINDSNPDANGKYHQSTIDYNRVPEHPFFKVVWKSLLQGIIECTGTNPKYIPEF